jgi:serine/threonine protein kinase
VKSRAEVQVEILGGPNVYAPNLCGDLMRLGYSRARPLTVPQTMEIVKGPRPDSILVIDAQNSDVEAICRELHGNPNAMPLILATTYDVDTCKPAGRVAQADDLVSVPVVAEEVLARLDILTSQASERDLRLPRCGEHIDQYTITGTIAWAEDSYVFKVHPDIGDKIQVMKMLSQEASRDENLVHHFDRELQMMDDFRGNDRIVQVLARGEFAGHAYCVMEYVDGSDVSHIIANRGRGNYDTVANVACGLAEALNAVHAAEIIHRNIKSEKVFVTKDGAVKLAGFGMALRSHESRLTEMDWATGMPRYTAPEIPMSGTVTAATDTYSYGATLYHLIAGRSPFEADNPSDMIRAHMTQAPMALSECRPEVPQDWDELVVNRCLAKDPENRPASMAEVLHLLDSMADARF